MLYGNKSALLVFDAGHESCDVALCVELESLHFCMELRSGSNVDVIVDLDVQEYGALKCMIFITYASRVTEPTGSEFERGVGVSTQFDIQAMVGTTETECLGSEVWRSLVEVRGRVEGWMEFSECHLATAIQ